MAKTTTPKTDKNVYVGVKGELPANFFCLNEFEELLIALHELNRDETAWGATKGLGYLREMAPYLRRILESYRKLVDRGLHSSNEREQQYARRLDEQLLDVVGAALGEAFRDERNAHGAFLLQLRELLKTHKGEYVLLAPNSQGIYEIRGIARDPGEFEKPEVRKYGELGRCFVRRIVEGAEKVPEFVLPTPE